MYGTMRFVTSDDGGIHGLAWTLGSATDADWWASSGATTSASRLCAAARNVRNSLPRRREWRSARRPARWRGICAGASPGVNNRRTGRFSCNRMPTGGRNFMHSRPHPSQLLTPLLWCCHGALITMRLSCRDPTLNVSANRSTD